MNESDRVVILAALIGVIGGFGVALYGSLSEYFKRLVKSIESLNVNVAVIVEKVNSHERRIERLEEKN